ncbi:MAG: lamin tail domain-containing protein [Spirochaetes bacterium]|nr:lamin tail domain-containing protein [Spirochaetota bacterium]
MKRFINRIILLISIILLVYGNLFAGAKIVITRVWCNNDYYGVDGFEIQNVGDSATNINGWAVADGDGTDAPFTSSDLTIQPGEIAIILNTGGGNENDATGIGTNYIWDLTQLFGGTVTTTESVAVGYGTSGNGFSGLTIFDALLYNDDGVTADDDAGAVVTAGQWSPDASGANHFNKNPNNVMIRTNFDSDTKIDWQSMTAATYPVGSTFWGSVALKKAIFYGTNDKCYVQVSDLDLAGGSQNINVKSDTDGTGITVTLYLKSTSIYTGSFGFSTVGSGGGKIQISNNDTITVTYTDLKDHDANAGNDDKIRTGVWYLSVPPKISNPLATPDLVLNDGLTTTLLTAKVSNRGDGIGNVYMDLSSISNSATQTMYDDATHGDQISSDGIYSYETTVPVISSKGEKSLPVRAYESNNIVYDTGSITLTVGGIAQSVIISEVMVNGSGSNDDEFVELYNPTSSAVNLQGWKLERKGYTGTPNNLLNSFPNKSIPAHGFFLIAPPEYTGSTAPDADYSTAEHMSGGSYGGTVVLYNNSGIVVDKLGYKGTGGTTGTCVDFEGDPYPVPPGPAPNGGSYERKAKISSTDTTMTNGGLDELKGNGWDTDRNDQDFIIRALSEPQNSTNTSETPGEKINITLSQVTTSTGYPKSARTLMAFKLDNTSTSNISTIRIQNKGTMLSNEILPLQIWRDANKDGLWQGGTDVYINTSTFANGKWTFSSLNIPSGTNYVLMTIFSNTVRHQRAFKGFINIDDIVGVDGAKNIAAASNQYYQIAFRMAPSIQSLKTNIDNGTASVTNNNSDTWDLTATLTENSNSGIVARLDLSALYGVSKITNLINYGGNLYALSNLTVPTSSPLSNQPVILRAYDAFQDVVTIQTTYITVTGNAPPQITSFIVNPTTVMAGNSVTFALNANDPDGSITSAVLNLSTIGGSAAQAMNSVTTTSWTLGYTIPQTILEGTNSIQVTVTDDLGSSAIAFVSLIVTEYKVEYYSDLNEAHPYNTIIPADVTKVKFVKLSQGTKITIYTISGNKIDELTATDAEVEWQIPDKLVAGVYIAYLKDAQGYTKTVKIIRIK